MNKRVLKSYLKSSKREILELNCFRYKDSFLISDIYFVSGQKGTIEDIYYDFMIESDLQIRKLFLSFNKANILLTSGCHFAFYNEKSNSFCTIGPTFGLMLNFKESKVLSKGINRWKN